MLRDGDVATLWTLDLTGSEILELAQTISAGQGTAPAGLVSVGIAKTKRLATVATSECEGEPLFVVAVNGRKANRYAAAVATAPGLAFRWDQGDTTLLVFGPPGAMPTTPPEVHQATNETWSALLHRAQLDERDARNRS